MQRHLFLLAAGMLHDGDEVPGDGLALGGDGAVEPERGQLLGAGRHGDQGEVGVLMLRSGTAPAAWTASGSLATRAAGLTGRTLG